MSFYYIMLCDGIEFIRSMKKTLTIEYLLPPNNYPIMTISAYAKRSFLLVLFNNSKKNA